MKHRVSGRKLGRTSAHRLAVLRNLSTELFERERIRTTLMKAKELRPFAERLITLSKSGTLHARRRAARHVMRADVLQKLFDTISARFAERPGGYTRILKLGPRRGDGAEMAMVELIGSEPKVTPSEDTGEKRALGRIRKRLTRQKAAPAAPESGAAEKAGAGKKKTASRKKASAKPRGRKASGGETATKPGGSAGGAKKKSSSGRKGAGKSSSK